MTPFNRLQISTALVAALLAGIVLHGGEAVAKDGFGQGYGVAANGAPADSTVKSPPIYKPPYKCLACRFVKRGDKHEPGHDMPGHDMSGHGDRHEKDHDKDHDRAHHGHGKYTKEQIELTCKGIAGCPRPPKPMGGTGTTGTAPSP